MKIKLDENLPDELVDLLASSQHDVHTVAAELLAGSADAVVFQAACVEQRMFFTQDLDFSDIRRFKPGSHPGVMLIRLRDPSRRRIIQRFQQIRRAESIESWAKCFVVIGETKLRVRAP